MPNLLVRVGTMSRALSWWVLPKCMDRCQSADDSYLCVLHVSMLCGLCWLMGDNLRLGQTSQNVYSDIVWAAEWWAEAL